MKPLVMIIDDDLGIVEMLTHALTNNGYDVLTASSGIIALNLLNHNISPDVIITDYQMPRLRGSELIERLSARNHLKDIPAVMITGSELENVSIPQTDNFKALIPKPFKINSLLETIDGIVKGKDFGSSVYTA